MDSFTGFQEKDFGTDVRGTHWRHRRALGGALRRGLRQVFGRHYETWGMPGVNSIHIARRAHYAFRARRAQAYLFVRALPTTLQWGLMIPAGGEHWRRFRFRLNHDPATLTTLVHLLSVYPLVFSDVRDSLGGALGGCWRFEQNILTWREACTLPSASILNDIPFRISQLPEDESVLLGIYTETTPAKAIAWDDDAAQRLLPILLALIPLYEMCVGGIGV